MMAVQRRLHPEEVAMKEDFWTWKKQEQRAAHAEKRRKKAWIETKFDNINKDLDDEDPCWLEYSFLTFKESTDEE
jgi:hypothetical protein